MLSDEVRRKYDLMLEDLMHVYGTVIEDSDEDAETTTIDNARTDERESQ